MPTQYDTADDRALRLYQITDLHRLRAAYLALPLQARRAYAAAHPRFTLTNNGLPEIVKLGVADAHDAGEPDLAADLAGAHRGRQIRMAANAAISAQHVPMPERVILAGAWGALTVPLAAISGLTGYLAAGPHAALVAACPALCLGALAILRRLATGSR